MVALCNSITLFVISHEFIHALYIFHLSLIGLLNQQFMFLPCILCGTFFTNINVCFVNLFFHFGFLVLEVTDPGIQDNFLVDLGAKDLTSFAH